MRTTKMGLVQQNRTQGMPNEFNHPLMSEACYMNRSDRINFGRLLKKYIPSLGVLAA
jgi:hypothetical protein